MVQIVAYQNLITLFVLLNLIFLASTRPLNVLNGINCPDDNNDFFERFSLGSIKDGPSPGIGHGPSPGTGHGVEDNATLGGIKVGSSHGVEHRYALGGIKEGPSPGVGHQFVDVEPLGGRKDSVPSPGVGH